MGGFAQNGKIKFVWNVQELLRLGTDSPMPQSREPGLDADENTC